MEEQINVEYNSYFNKRGVSKSFKSRYQVMRKKASTAFWLQYEELKLQTNLDIRIIKRMHELLLIENTGTPKQFACKLEISERTLYNYLGFIKKEMNAKLEYNVQKSTYAYIEECGFCFESK